MAALAYTFPAPVTRQYAESRLCGATIWGEWVGFAYSGELVSGARVDRSESRRPLACARGSVAFR